MVVEIESASLSRDIPIFVEFIPGVSSYIRSTPKESMESVLLSIRRQFVAPNIGDAHLLAPGEPADARCTGARR